MDLKKPTEELFVNIIRSIHPTATIATLKPPLETDTELALGYTTLKGKHKTLVIPFRRNPLQSLFAVIAAQEVHLLPYRVVDLPSPVYVASKKFPYSVHLLNYRGADGKTVYVVDFSALKVSHQVDFPIKPSKKWLERLLASEDVVRTAEGLARHERNGSMSAAAYPVLCAQLDRDVIRALFPAP